MHIREPPHPPVGSISTNLYRVAASGRMRECLTILYRIILSRNRIRKMCRKNGREGAVAKQSKSFDRPFSKGRGFLGQRPKPTSAEVGTPKTSKEFLFLLLFLLDKGEKEERNDLNYRRAVASSPFLKLMRQPPHDHSVFFAYSLESESSSVIAPSVSSRAAALASKFASASRTASSARAAPPPTTSVSVSATPGLSGARTV